MRARRSPARLRDDSYGSMAADWAADWGIVNPSWGGATWEESRRDMPSAVGSVFGGGMSGMSGMSGLGGMAGTGGTDAQRRRTRRRPGTPSTLALAVRGLVCGVSVLALLRMMVLVSEAYAMVVSEREAEDELVAMCAQGVAGRSAHMRNACMNATVDRANFVLVRAIVKGVTAFGRDAYVFLSSPFRAGAWVSCVWVMGVLPWLGPLKSALWPAPAPPVQPDQRVIILHDGRAPALSAPGLQSRLKTMPMIEDVPLDDGPSGPDAADEGFKEV